MAALRVVDYSEDIVYLDKADVVHSTESNLVLSLNIHRAKIPRPFRENLRVQPRHPNSRGIANNGHSCQSPSSDPRRPRRGSYHETGQHLQGGACKAHWSLQGISRWKNLLLPHQSHETLRLC